MAHDDATPRPLQHRDAAALIGVTAVLEGHLLIGELDRHLVDALVRHLHEAGLVAADAGPADLRLALANLNQRIRYAIGEHDAPPAHDTGEADQYFGFPSRTAAESFAEAAVARGETAATPVAVDGRGYDDDIGWQVAVRTAELPLSAAFDRHVLRLAALAGEHGGAYGGWGSAPVS